ACRQKGTHPLSLSRLSQAFDRRLDILVTRFDQHARDIVDNWIFAATAGLLAYQPRAVHQLQSSRIGPLSSGWPADTVRATQNIEQFLAHHALLSISNNAQPI